jgi:hypothetical protein
VGPRVIEMGAEGEPAALPPTARTSMPIFGSFLEQKAEKATEAAADYLSPTANCET